MAFIPPSKILFKSDETEAEFVDAVKTKGKTPITLFVYRYTKSKVKLNKTVEFPQTQIEEMIRKNIVTPF
jgi:uncharacterized protein YdhG (YjbR/CyaY superfamily)